MLFLIEKEQEEGNGQFLSSERLSTRERPRAVHHVDVPDDFSCS